MTTARETASLEKAIDKLELAHENAMRAMRYDENPYEHIRRAKMQASTAVWRFERILEGAEPDDRDEGVLTLEGKTMDALQREIVTWAVRRHGGKAQAARALGVHRRTLQRWVTRHERRERARAGRRHEWVSRKSLPFLSCASCGIVRKRDGSNDENSCRGPVQVTTRKGSRGRR